jgi:hypothetical protein
MYIKLFIKVNILHNKRFLNTWYMSSSVVIPPMPYVLSDFLTWLTLGPSWSLGRANLLIPLKGSGDEKIPS